MRRADWILGLLLGTIAGGSMLELGAFALPVIALSIVWAAREPLRPFGLAGLLVGVGVGAGGLFALADARCAAVDSAASGAVWSCSSPDATPYLAVALVLVAVGVSLTMFSVRRASRSADRGARHAEHRRAEQN